jgi:hypothetical protein
VQRLILFAAKVGFELPTPPVIRYRIGSARVGQDKAEESNDRMPTFIRDELFYGNADGGWVVRTPLLTPEGEWGK